MDRMSTSPHGSESENVLLTDMSFYRREIARAEQQLLSRKKHLREPLPTVHGEYPPVVQMSDKRQRGRLVVPKDRTAQEGEAREYRIVSNIRLVPYLLRKYRNVKSIDTMDLVQEGNLGLIHAVERFDESRGFKFSSYAAWWIEQYIAIAVVKQANTIRIPVYKNNEIKRVFRSQLALEKALNHEPTTEEIAEHLQTSTQKVDAILATPHYEVLSLDVLLPSGHDGSLQDTFIAAPESDPEQLVARATLKEHIQRLLRRLTARERQVLELRFGLSIEHSLQDIKREEGKEYTLVEAGKTLGVSYEAIRKAEKRALQKLLPLCKEESLDLYLP